MDQISLTWNIKQAKVGFLKLRNEKAGVEKLETQENSGFAFACELRKTDKTEFKAIYAPKV